jgi:hypothetical protein
MNFVKPDLIPKEGAPKEIIKRQNPLLRLTKIYFSQKRKIKTRPAWKFKRLRLIILRFLFFV